MKNRFIFILLAALAFSCDRETEKDITTDLQTEGNEIFRVSLALEESQTYAFYSFEEYQRLNSSALPGCPDISLDTQNRSVTLFFSAKADCISQRVKRSGKIIINYITTPQLNRQTHLVYEDYKFNNNPVSGTRIFQRSGFFISSGSWLESTEDLLIYTPEGSSTKITGSFIHNIQLSNGLINEIVSIGELEGRNITGRRITMSRVVPRKYRNDCLLAGRTLSLQGAENWQIYRTNQLAVSHNLVFELVEGCISSAKIVLHDGRSMIFEL
jgi:hypothetical protein